MPLDPVRVDESPPTGPNLGTGSRRPRLARLARWVAVLLPAISLVWLLAYGFRTNPREIDYGVYGIPETFFIGHDGRILGKHVGAIGPDRLRASLDATLEGSAVAPEGSGKGAYQPIR